MTPTLVMVTGPPGTGKTTLAHALAARIGCPAISRDEIKEGMAHADPDFGAAGQDELSLRTLPVFFRVLELLLRAEVTTVAEAAFQDRLWRPGLEPLRRLARFRVVRCTVDADVAFARRIRRWEQDWSRVVHEDLRTLEAAEHALLHESFQWVSLNVPTMEVDTTDGYRPSLDEIAAFAG